MKVSGIMLGAALVGLVVLLAGCGGTTDTTGTTTAVGTWDFGATTLVPQDAGGANIAVTGGVLNLRSLASAAVNDAAAQFTDSGGKVRTFTGSYSLNGTFVSGAGLTGVDGTLSFTGTLFSMGIMTGNLEYHDTGGALYRGSFTASKVSG